MKKRKEGGEGEGDKREISSIPIPLSTLRERINSPSSRMSKTLAR